MPCHDHLSNMSDIDTAFLGLAPVPHVPQLGMAAAVLVPYISQLVVVMVASVLVCQLPHLVVMVRRVPALGSRAFALSKVSTSCQSYLLGTTEKGIAALPRQAQENFPTEPGNRILTSSSWRPEIPEAVASCSPPVWDCSSRRISAMINASLAVEELSS